MGLEHRIGRIAPGFAADLALLDLDGLAFTPLNDVRRQLVYCETGASVRLTMVAGQVVVRDGRVLSVDEDAIKAEARELAAALGADPRAGRGGRARPGAVLPGHVPARGGHGRRHESMGAGIFA